MLLIWALPESLPVSAGVPGGGLSDFHGYRAGRSRPRAGRSRDGIFCYKKGGCITVKGAERLLYVTLSQ